jgi:CheY-like chemotaxis protein
MRAIRCRTEISWIPVNRIAGPQALPAVAAERKADTGLGMEGDLLVLQVLVVSSGARERALMREAALNANAPIQVVEADGAITAFAILAGGGIDIAFLDSIIPIADRVAIMKAARSNQRPPFLVLLTALGDSSSDEGGEGFVPDGTAEKPNTVESAMMLIDRTSRLRRCARVLVVDDSSTMRKIVRKILAASRFHLDISEAEEGYSALELIGNGHFDFVFLDHNMPGLNGVETLAQMKRQHPQLQVVIMTSTPDDALIRRARIGGAAAFLKKPFFPPHIDAVLHSLYGLRPPAVPQV